jgi:hypothetical protein
LNKSKGKMEKFTISSGFTAAHDHSVLLGQGLAGWPNTAAFGMAHAPAHSQSVRSARPVRGHCMVRSQRMRRGVVLTGTLVAQR